MVKNKPHIIIQARTGSSRLPNKVMTLINGIPMIGYLFNRLKTSGFPIILATSIKSENDLLVEFAKKNDILVYRGNEENVLERFYKAAKIYNSKDIIRVTGDNPFVDGEFLKNQYNCFNPISRRYYVNQGKVKKIPLGLTFEIFSYELLKEAFENAKSKHEKEHVTVYMHQNIPKNIDLYTFDNSINFPEARITVDTEKDFELISKMIIDYNCDQKNIFEIIKILKANKFLLDINSEVKQKDWNE